MAQYTPVGPFNQGSSPPINKTFLDGVENALVAGGMIYFLGSPFHLTTNPTVNNGATSTLTCTGGSTGVPSGAKGVIIGGGISSGTIGAYTTIAPTGGTLGRYGGQVATLGGTALAEFSPFPAPLSAGGQLDVHANGGNIVLQDWYIIAYIM